MFGYINGSSAFEKPLSPEEEAKYLQEFAEGSVEAKNILIEHNLRLVAHIAKKYSNYSGDNEDLISIGTVGLIKGILTYKLDKNSKLSTYVARCIENEILMALRSSKKYRNDMHLQEPIGVDKEGNEVSIEDKISDEDKNIEEEVETSLEIVEMLKNVEVVLEEKEKKIIKMRYGIGCVEKPQREIAEIMGISRSYVSRIETRALKKLYKAMNKYQ